MLNCLSSPNNRIFTCNMRIRFFTFFTFFLIAGIQPLLSQASKEAQLIVLYEHEKDPKQKMLRMLALGNYYKRNNVFRADSISKKVLDKSREFDDDSIRFEALMFKASVAKLNGDNDEYFQRVLECQAFMNMLSSDDILFRNYCHLGDCFTQSNEFETAYFYLQLASKIAFKENSNKKISRVNSLIALNFMTANQKDSAVYFANESIKYARRNADKTTMAISINTLAIVYDFFGQVELSVGKNLVSLKFAEEVNNTLLLAKLTREIGQSQSLILNLDDARSYFDRSLGYSRKVSDYRQMGLAYTQLAHVELLHRKFKKAHDNAYEAIDYLTRLNDLNGLGETHNILGLIYLEQQRYDLATDNFNQALVYFESTKNREEIAEVYHNVGTVFQKQKNYSRALHHLSRSVEIRKNYGSKNQVYKTYRVMADVYKSTNNPTKSLEYMELYLNYVDSNATVQAATKIAELSESYLADQRERLINSQTDSIERERNSRLISDKELKYSQLRNSFQLSIIITTFVIITLAGIIIFYRWNQSRIQQERREAEMSQTLLRTQMNPHFVFNAMSVIQSYIYEHDVENSTKFLVNFSRLMRLILENSSKEYIPLRTEIEILRKYLETQKLRFEDRFQYFVEAEDQLIEELAVIPPMITQPFIENSIEHGQLHTIEGGFIRVRFEKNNGMLNIIIEDNGVGRKASKQNKKSSAHKSMAMKITSDRINNINKKYKSQGFMKVEDYNQDEKTGTKVLISLPYSTEFNPENQTP